MAVSVTDETKHTAPLNVKWEKTIFGMKAAQQIGRPWKEIWLCTLTGVPAEGASNEVESTGRLTEPINGETPTGQKWTTTH